MSWTVACFCGTVFDSPPERCPVCHTPVPEVTSAADVAESAHQPDILAELPPDAPPTAALTAARP